MFVTKIKLRNWRNFKKVEIDLSETLYMIGANASGKSNFLDVFRFIRDIVDPKGGGLQKAVENRGGMTKLRSVYARQKPTVDIEIDLDDSNSVSGKAPKWRYELSVKGEGRGKHRNLVNKERVLENGTEIFSRPDNDDKNDQERLTQTFLEQINMNKAFREIADFFSKVMYLHLVPQLLKFGDFPGTNRLSNDPYGLGFLEQISGAPKRTRDSRLNKIEIILKNVIPYFEKLRFVKDDKTGLPHIEMRYVHWRPNAGWQREDQFSDGTLRLIGIIWVLLTSSNLILLEEPELSLHNKIIEQIPQIIYQTHKFRNKSGGQIVISTHSESLMRNTSLSGTFIILKPAEDGEGTTIVTPSKMDKTAMQAGMSAADILFPQTADAIGNV